MDAGVLTADEAEASITSEFNPVRVAFHGQPPIYTKDVLNLGVSPAALVAAAHARFVHGGGRVLQLTRLEGVWVHPGGARLQLAGGEELTARLVVDAMGSASPIVRQVRWGAKPDGVCMVVGCCARGPWRDNSSSDVIATCSPSQPPAAAAGDRSSMGSNRNDSTGNGSQASSNGAPAGRLTSRPGNLQYFWESFPAGSGPNDRTMYQFTYLDAAPSRPSLEAMLDDFWELLPEYQGVRLEDLEVQRVLFGCFFTYRDSPLRPRFDRILQVGDAAGLQSPLSFGEALPCGGWWVKWVGWVGDGLLSTALGSCQAASSGSHTDGRGGSQPIAGGVRWWGPAVPCREQCLTACVVLLRRWVWLVGAPHPPLVTGGGRGSGDRFPGHREPGADQRLQPGGYRRPVALLSCAQYYIQICV